MDRILNSVVSIYYPLFFVVSITVQLLLFHLIFNKTPKMLRKMRYFLYPLNATNSILSSLAFFLQFRNVHNTKSFAIMCQGPCKFLGPEYCFHAYVATLAAVALGGCLNLHTLYYRMVSIKYHENVNWRVSIFSILHISPIVVIILSYIPPLDFDAVYYETLADHPEYDFGPYHRFGGFASAHVCNVLVTLFLLALGIFAPTLGYYCRREALKVLDKSFNSLSEHSVSQFKALIHCLGLQLLLPLICDVPVGFFYMFNKFSGSEIHISQYTLGVMITLPALLDPILQIAFITPYRNAVKQMFCCDFGRKNSESGAARRDTITDTQRRISWQPNNGASNNVLKHNSISNSR